MDAILLGEAGRQQLDSLIEQQLRDEVAGLSAEELEELGDVDLYVASVKLQTLSVLESRWFSEFLALDPSISAAGCSCPVLAVYGSLDLQVDPDVNGPGMQAVLESDPSSSVVVLEGVNHLFQTAVTGGIEEYGTLEEAFDPALMPLLLSWLGTLP
jgi:pimeloyl-ACP methyl ester carboxylesterase